MSIMLTFLFAFETTQKKLRNFELQFRGLLAPRAPLISVYLRMVRIAVVLTVIVLYGLGLLNI